MNKTYWLYETSIDNNTNVSIRGKKGCSNTEYQKYLSKFINKYDKNIMDIGDTCLFKNGERCTIIYLNNSITIEFPDHPF